MNQAINRRMCLFNKVSTACVWHFKDFFFLINFLDVFLHFLKWEVIIKIDALRWYCRQSCCHTFWDTQLMCSFNPWSPSIFYIPMKNSCWDIVWTLSSIQGIHERILSLICTFLTNRRKTGITARKCTWRLWPGGRYAEQPRHCCTWFQWFSV